MHTEVIGNATLILGDCRQVLPTLPDQSVHCCVTSPPYMGQRDYGHPCQMGREATPDEFVAALVGVFREVRRVLREDGTVWLNLGDSYTGSGKGGNPGGSVHQKQHTNRGTLRNTPKLDFGLGKKQLIGIPWRTAFALQEDGWILRQEIIWNKPNAMPESVQDRCTRAHEYIFMFSKSERYYYDAGAIAEPARCKDIKKFTDNGIDKQRGHSRRHAGFNGRYAQRIAEDGVPTTRNRRSVWTVATQPFSGAHFATFPPKLIEPCILAGCPVGGTVLDPFSGTGTTAMVSVQHGRSAIGLELNPEYMAMACERIENAQRQQRLVL